MNCLFEVSVLRRQGYLFQRRLRFWPTQVVSSGGTIYHVDGLLYVSSLNPSCGPECDHFASFWPVGDASDSLAFIPQLAPINPRFV
jgi:hypothetical protein